MLVVSSSGAPYSSDVTINWSNGMTGDTIWVTRADTAITYTATVAEDSCIYTPSVTVPAVFGNATIAVLGNACQGNDTIVLDANSLDTNNGYTYTWNTGATTDSIHVVVQNGITYTVTVSNGIGCIDTASITLRPINAPTISVTPAGFSCTGVDSISLVTVADTGVTYVWNTGDSTSVLIPDTAGIYIVTVTNAAGCQASDTVNVTNAAFTGIVVGSNVGIANVTAALAATNPILPMPAAASNSQIIIVDGAFTIDQNYTFAQGSEIIARAKSVITIPNGKTLTIQPGVHIYGCDTLWQGIVVSMGGGLVMNGTEQQRILVEDAVYGVRLNNNCYPSISFVTFNNNYIGVYAAFSAYSGIPGMQPFIRNIFTSTAVLKPIYSGYNPGSIPMPTTVTRGYCGIYIRNISYFTVRYNEFSNVCNGIVAYNSRLTAAQCDFENLVAHGYSALADYLYPIGTGVYMRHIYTNILTNATPSSVSVISCNTPTFHFEKCLYGVYSDGAHTSVRSCVMDSITAYGISVRNASGRNITIFANVISVGLRGISVINSDPVISMNIRYNNILIFGIGNAFAGYGVEIAETGNMHIMQPLIQNNFVFNAANSFYGFWNNGTNGHLFRLNKVTLINPTRAYAAIAHTGANKLDSKRNSVLAFAPSVQNGTGYPAAFTYDYSNGTFECDSSQGTYTGVYMYGQLGSSQMRGYSIGSHTNGLHVARYAKIQAQPPLSSEIKNGNKWIGNYSGKAALNENGEGILTNMDDWFQWIYPHVPDSVFPYNPNRRWTTTANFIRPQPLTTSDFSQCGINGVGLSPGYTLGPFELLVIKDSVQYDVYAGEMQWQDRWAVYTRLMADMDSMVIDSATQAFVDYCDTSNIGKLYTIQQARAAAMLADGNMLAAQAKVDTLFELLAINDSVRSIDTAAIWQAQHVTLMDSLYAADSLLQMYSYMHDSIRNATLDSLLALNSTLTQGNTAEDNMIRFNDVYMKTLARDSMPNRIQELEVSYLAYQCPFIGGEAVYKARTMALLIQDTVFNNQNLCYTDSGSLRMLRKPTSDEKVNNKQAITHTDVHYSLYPNPASSKVTLSCNTSFCAGCRVVFYDVFGRETIATTLPYAEYKVELDVQHLQTGLYLVHITNKNGDLYTSKLNIIK